jgi:hypothetical protein
LSEALDPGAKGDLLRRTGLNALAAGVSDAERGFAQEQGVFRTLRIDEDDERFAERFDAIGRGALLWELKAGSGGYAIGVVAGAASGFFEEGVDGFGE